MWRIFRGDSRDRLQSLQGFNVSSVVCDPPYEIGYNKRAWDSTGIAHDPEFWSLVSGTMAPGAHLLAFGATRTYHRMVTAIEEAGFEIRDCLSWLYASGMPKGMNVGLAIDKELRGFPQGGRDPEGHLHGKTTGAARGAGSAKWLKAGETYTKPTRKLHKKARPYVGLGTALKPAQELIVLARKPTGKRTVATNTLEFGTGALNIDACRLPDGKIPANVIHDGRKATVAGLGERSRYFYCAKPSKRERSQQGEVDNKHATVKPIALMRYLVRLVTPCGGVVLDPFMGSGTTGCAAIAEGFDFIGCELERDSYRTARDRLRAWQARLQEEQP